MIGKGIKIAGAGLIAWLVATNAWPAMSEAWKARQAAVAVSSSSSGMTMAEVATKYLAALEQKGVKSISRSDIEVTKDGERWIVGANYEVSKKLVGSTSLIYDFSISADKKALW